MSTKRDFPHTEKILLFPSTDCQCIKKTLTVLPRATFRCRWTDSYVFNDLLPKKIKSFVRHHRSCHKPWRPFCKNFHAFLTSHVKDITKDHIQMIFWSSGRGKKKSDMTSRVALPHVICWRQRLWIQRNSRVTWTLSSRLSEALGWKKYMIVFTTFKWRMKRMSRVNCRLVVQDAILRHTISIRFPFEVFWKITTFFSDDRLFEDDIRGCFPYPNGSHIKILHPGWQQRILKSSRIFFLLSTTHILNSMSISRRSAVNRSRIKVKVSASLRFPRDWIWKLITHSRQKKRVTTSRACSHSTDVKLWSWWGAVVKKVITTVNILEVKSSANSVTDLDDQHWNIYITTRGRGSSVTVSSDALRPLERHCRERLHPSEQRLDNPTQFHPMKSSSDQRARALRNRAVHVEVTVVILITGGRYWHRAGSATPIRCISICVLPTLPRTRIIRIKNIVSSDLVSRICWSSSIPSEDDSVQTNATKGDGVTLEIARKKNERMYPELADDHGRWGDPSPI